MNVTTNLSFVKTVTLEISDTETTFRYDSDEDYFMVNGEIVSREDMQKLTCELVGLDEIEDSEMETFSL